jgi:hypothetical protein
VAQRLAVAGGTLYVISTGAPPGLPAAVLFAGSAVVDGPSDSSARLDVADLTRFNSRPVTLSGPVTVGRLLKGDLVVDVAGTIKLGPLVVGDLPPSVGTATLFGHIETPRADVIVGNYGKGTLTARNATITCSALRVGAEALGRGTLSAVDRSVVSAASLYVGSGLLSTANLTVDRGTMLLVNGPSDFGGGDFSTTTVADNSIAFLTNGPTTVGAGTMATATVIVGDGSQWSVGTASARAGRSTLSVGNSLSAGARGAARVYLVGGSCLSANSVAVNPSGFLEGTGTVNADIAVNNGTILPGNASVTGHDSAEIGTLYVAGNVNMGASGALGIDVSTTASDTLAVQADSAPGGTSKGDVTLAGKLVVSELPNFQAQAGKAFTVLMYTGSRTGVFTLDTRQAPLPAGDSWHLNYDTPGKVILEVIGAQGKGLSATEGQALPANTQVATILGVADQNDAANFSATIDWGYKNGSGQEATSTGTVSYSAAAGGAVVEGGTTYPEEGVYAVRVAISDGGAPLATTDAPATIADAPLTATSAISSYVTFAAWPNVNLTTATFTDAAGGPAGQDGYTATIDWGDGTPQSPDISAGTVTCDGYGHLTATGSHTYTRPGNFTVTTTASDDGGSTATTAGAIAVHDVNLSAPNREMAEPSGSTYGLPVADFADEDGPPALAAYTATIDWSDNSATPGVITETGPGSGLFVVTAGPTAPPNTNPQTVTICDTADPAAPPHTVCARDYFEPSDLITPLGAPGVPIEGAPFSGVVDAFTDPAAGSFSATVTWPDASTSPGVVQVSPLDSQLYIVSASGHTFTQSANVVGVSVSDGTTSESWYVMMPVAEAPLTVSVAPSTAPAEGIAFSGVVAAPARRRPPQGLGTGGIRLWPLREKEVARTAA